MLNSIQYWDDEDVEYVLGSAYSSLPNAATGNVDLAHQELQEHALLSNMRKERENVSISSSSKMVT